MKIFLLHSDSLLAVGHEAKRLRIYFKRGDAPGAVWEYDLDAYNTGETCTYSARQIVDCIRDAPSPGSYWSARWRAAVTPHGHQLFDDELAGAMADLEEAQVTEQEEIDARNMASEREESGV